MDDPEDGPREKEVYRSTRKFGVGTGVVEEGRPCSRGIPKDTDRQGSRRVTSVKDSDTTYLFTVCLSVCPHPPFTPVRVPSSPGVPYRLSFTSEKSVSQYPGT